MFGLFWDGVAVGAIGAVLPSLIMFAVLVAKAQDVLEEGSTPLQHELLPLSMECSASGL